MTVADAAAPETGDGKKEDKGGGRKGKEYSQAAHAETVAATEEAMVYPLMGLLFLGSMWLIFAPSEEQGVNRDTVGAFNADIPLPENDRMIGDKRKAYEQAQAEKQQAEKVRSLEDFAFSEESDTDGVEMELPDSEPEREPFRDYSDNGGGSRSSLLPTGTSTVSSARFTRSRRWTGKGGAEKAGGGADRQAGRKGTAGGRNRRSGGADGEELRACRQVHGTERAGRRSRAGPATGQDGNGLGQPAVAVQAARERTVSGLQQPLSDAEFMRRYSQPRNYGFNTAVAQRVRYGEEHDTGVHPRGSDDYGRTDGEAPGCSNRCKRETL